MSTPRGICETFVKKKLPEYMQTVRYVFKFFSSFFKIPFIKIPFKNLNNEKDLSLINLYILFSLILS